ncbi:MmgE/PrpD family protein [Micromonospora sp. NPDC005087]|uniref:MmgE/PrpD family protein n=1 Tax=Micromonospora sp. NPDC005087 TaxID=3364225 RepID=UPI0036B45231
MNQRIGAPTLTQRLVGHLRALTYDTIPEEAKQTARAVFADGIGVALAGLREPLGVGDVALRYVREIGGAEQATVIGAGMRTSMTDAAFVNGTLMHALDFDNTWYPMNHPTSPTLPAILALAEHYGFNGQDCLTALVAAFEVQGRLRMASLGLKTGHGFHKPGTTGLMGAVAAGVKLLGLDDDQALMAFGTAGSRVGSFSVNTGTMTKSSHSGHAARNGVECALLAQMGWTAARDIFGPEGYFDTLMPNDQTPELLVEGFADPLRMVEPGVGFKRFPSNYFTHRPITAALRLRERLLQRPDFQISQIAEVVVHFPELDYVDRPQPDTGLDGKFSVQYTTTLGLLDGQVGIDSFTNDRRFAADVVDLLPRVRIEYEPEISKEFLYLHVVVDVRLTDGTVLSERVDKLSGMPGVPLTESERRDKFDMCVTPALGDAASAKLFELASHVDELEDMRELMEIAAGTARQA